MTDFRISPRIWAALLAAGVMAGLAGMGLTLWLHAVQHAAYGVGWQVQESFHDMATHAPPLRRLAALLACGALAGAGWALLLRRGAPLVDVEAAIATPGKTLPLKTTLAHALLQITTVGMGSPLGREGAPREISAALAGRLARLMRCDASATRLLLACAASAGLAAVCNAPLTGALFALETLLPHWNLPVVAAALLANGVAVTVARLGLGDMVQYGAFSTALTAAVTPPLLAWAALAGPLLGAAAHAFNRSLRGLPLLPRASIGGMLLPVAAFGLIGGMAVVLPDVLGNGKAGNLLSFAGSIGWQMALALLAAKWLAVWLATAAGAYGGRITPSLMVGGMLALALASAWNAALMPPLATGAAAIVGAAVFLGLTQRMPLTAMVMALEMSRLTPAWLLPLCLCMATALPVHLWMERPRQPLE